MLIFGWRLRGNIPRLFLLSSLTFIPYSQTKGISVTPKDLVDWCLVHFLLEHHELVMCLVH